MFLIPKQNLRYFRQYMVFESILKSPSTKIVDKWVKQGYFMMMQVLRMISDVMMRISFGFQISKGRPDKNVPKIV